MAINGRNIQLLPINELMAIVRQDLKKFDNEGLIDEGTCIKTIMYCNDTLGLYVREVKQICLPVLDGKAKLPLDFEKIYYACGLQDTRKLALLMKNPFDNKVDADVIYEAKINSEKIGCDTPVTIHINRKTEVTIHEYQNWVQLDIHPSSTKFCYGNSPLLHKRGNGKIILNDDNTLTVPFKEGEVYIMYVANMRDEEGNLLFPFHPKITPWYEWCIKEKIVMDAIFNSDGNYGDLLKLTKQERALAWIDAFNSSTDEAFGEYIKREKKKELQWFKQYFAYVK